MSKPWPLVPLGEVVTHRKEFIRINDLETYKRCRVQLHAQGIVLRDIVPGAEIKTKEQQICRAGEFLVAEIDAKVGGFGIVPENLDSAIVSSHYMPLPPFSEQQQLVARIEELAAKIEEARGLRRQAVEEAEVFVQAFLNGEHASNIARFGETKLDKVCLTVTDGDHQTPTFVDAGVKFIFVGNVSSGLLHFSGCKYVTPEYYASIKPHRKPQVGDILYSAVGATLGIPAIVNCTEDFCFQRHVALIKPDRNRLVPEFLWYMLRSGTLYKKAWAATTGSAQPTVPLRAIRALPIPIPSLSEQRRIVAYLDDLQTKVDALKLLQAETTAELGALLPSVLDKAFKGEL